MRVFVSCLAVMLASFARPARAQDPPPKIPLFAVDLHATVPQFPSDDPLLAASRGMVVGELPGTGLGVQVGVHMYPLRLRAVTFGVGGELAIGRAQQTPMTVATTGTTTATNRTPLRPAEERFTSLSPQLSLNFGNGSGWSYLSAGLGQSTWSIEPGHAWALHDPSSLQTSQTSRLALPQPGSRAPQPQSQPFACP